MVLMLQMLDGLKKKCKERKLRVLREPSFHTHGAVVSLPIFKVEQRAAQSSLH